MNNPVLIRILLKLSGVRCAVPHFSRALPLSAAVIAVLTIANGCVASRSAYQPADYVEIDNPVSDGSPENSKVWVPRSFLEQGIPRGRDLVQKGYDAVAGTDTPVPSGPRNRLLLVEQGDSRLAAPLGRLLARGCIVRPAVLAPDTPLASENDRLAFIGSFATKPLGGPVLIISATAGGAPGSQLQGEFYDSRGPVLIRSFRQEIAPADKDETGEQALQRSLNSLADAVVKSLAWFPWYGRVVTVRGERVYLDAGAESGLKPGAQLAVFRGGELVKGIGFAPGERIASIEVRELVGPDGAYAVSPEAGSIQSGDFVELIQ